MTQGLYELSPRFSLASRGRITVLTVVIPHRCTHIVVDPPCRASSVRAQAAGRGAGHVAAVVIFPLLAFPAGSI